jgi:hypothetical protein
MGKKAIPTIQRTGNASVTDMEATRLRQRWEAQKAENPALARFSELQPGAILIQFQELLEFMERCRHLYEDARERVAELELELRSCEEQIAGEQRRTQEQFDRAEAAEARAKQYAEEAVEWRRDTREALKRLEEERERLARLSGGGSLDPFSESEIDSAFDGLSGFPPEIAPVTTPPRPTPRRTVADTEPGPSLDAAFPASEAPTAVGTPEGMEPVEDEPPRDTVPFGYPIPSSAPPSDTTQEAEDDVPQRMTMVFDPKLGPVSLEDPPSGPPSLYGPPTTRHPCVVRTGGPKKDKT